jgi:pilus assembly protein CpaB
MAQGSKRRGRIFIYLAIILVLGVVMVFILTQRGGLSQGQEAKAPDASDVVEIVITSQPISRGVTLTADVLSTVSYPRSEMVEGTFFTDIQEVVGKRAKIDLDARVPLTSSMVVDATGGSVTSFEIPAGMVAISIPIPHRLSSISYAPQPGDHVNIIASLNFVDVDNSFQSILPNRTAVVTAPGVSESGTTLTSGIMGGGDGSLLGRAEMDPTLGQPVYVVPSEVQRSRLVSQTLLQDIMVLHVGNFDLEGQATQTTETGQTTATTTTTNGETTTTTPTSPDVITVVVTPQDAVTLNYLIFSDAKLTLVLRGAGDEQRIQTEAVTLQYLLDQYNIPVPAKLPYATQPRTDALAFPSLPNDSPTSEPQ